MCMENNISEKLRKGILIDAPFPLNTVMTNTILAKEGFDPEKDYLTVQTQFDNQYSELKYLKSVFELDDSGKKTGEKLRCFILTLPDRYVPKEGENHGMIVTKKEESQ